jgi:hypothetical protein
VNAVTRFGLWLVKVSAPPESDPRVRAIIDAAEDGMCEVERDQQAIRERLALAIYQAKADNILRKPETRRRPDDA